MLGEARPKRFLDIGTGAGRHLSLAADLGFDPVGIDVSWNGLRHAKERMPGAMDCLIASRMDRLPFAGDSFHAALSFGVFYYGTKAEMMGGVAEAKRVLAPGGRLLVVLRTKDDYRFGKGKELEANTFQLEIEETNEPGTIQHFLDENDVRDYFREFSQLSFEKSETTFANRTRLDSDWVIIATK